MSKSSRSISAILLLVGLFVAGPPAAASAEDLYASAGFVKIPAQVQLGAMSGVAVDAEDRVYILHRGTPPLIVFDAKGDYVAGWGEKLFKVAHGLRVDAEGNVWTTDNGNHVIRKFSRTGELLATLGEVDKGGNDETHFRAPDDVVFSKKGEIFVADSGNARIVKLSPEGKFLLQWGGRGRRPGEFATAHGLAIDANDRVYVADRGNKRVQVFDSEGKFVAEWAGFGNPFGLLVAGKELIASAIHKNSRRKGAAFVRLNCAALAEGILESELFGHERGAFTGANGTRKGRFEQADGGTLFLDEVSELPAGVQVKLLRFLQERELERVGGNETIRVDVRVVAASNRDLRVLVEDGRFREDLYYRLNVVRIDMPPLRTRPSDIPLLAEHFLARFAEENEADVQGFSEAAIQLMLAYPWPGNVRELMNVVEQAVVLTSGPLVEASELSIRSTHRPQAALPLMVPGVTLAEVERYVIIKTLEAVDGSRHRAAETLGISRRTLQYRLQEWGIEPRKFLRGDRKDGLD